MRSAYASILIILSIAAAVSLTAGLSIAQTTPGLEQLQIDLWPEYDRPDMLVIYRGTLPADTPLPATLTFRLPMRVGEPHAVAYADETGSLLQAEYSYTTTEDWLLVTLETPTSNFQLEYYDSLTRVGEKRSYTFVWPGDYAVDQLSFGLIPPPGANEIQTEPALSPFQQDEGSSSYWGTLGRLPVEQDAQLTVSYIGAVVGFSEAASPATNDENNNIPLLIGAAIAALLLAIGGGVWYTRRPRPRSAQASPSQRHPARGRRSRSRKTSAHDRPSPAGYCTQCGHPLRADDRFCSHCGKPVKRKKEVRD